jgi:hypothetical protein
MPEILAGVLATLLSPSSEAFVSSRKLLANASGGYEVSSCLFFFPIYDFYMLLAQGSIDDFSGGVATNAAGRQATPAKARMATRADIKDDSDE